MFRSWRLCDIARSRIDFRFRGKSGRAADITGMTEFDQLRHGRLKTFAAQKHCSFLR